MWTRKLGTSITTHRGRIACVVIVWLLAASSIGAQEAELTGFRLETGLQSFFSGGGRSVEVTVTDVGAPTAESSVKIVFYNADGRIVARGGGVLKPRQPVSVALPLDMNEPRVKLRAVVTVVGQRDRGSLPVVVLEDIDPGSFTIGQRISCAPPVSSLDPVLPSCPDVVIRNFTLDR